jgi:hypothetical protein
MFKRVCKKHATWIGCAAAAVTFMALHVAVPALVATGVASHAHAKPESVRPDVVLQVDDVVVYRIVTAGRICLVAVAEGRMADTVDVECVR